MIQGQKYGVRIIIDAEQTWFVELLDCHWHDEPSNDSLLKVPTGNRCIHGAAHERI